MINLRRLAPFAFEPPPRTRRDHSTPCLNENDWEPASGLLVPPDRDDP